MKYKILKQQKFWKVVKTDTKPRQEAFIYATLNIPKGFKVALKKPSCQSKAYMDKKGNEILVLYAYKKIGGEKWNQKNYTFQEA